MTPHGRVTPSSADDAQELAVTLRPEDKRELEEVGNRPVLTTLLLGVMMSEPCHTLRTNEGALVGIVGVVKGPGDGGAVWMACTEHLQHNRIAFLRGGPAILEHLHERYETLYNVCDARNEVHVQWLRWMGFSIFNRIDEFGPNRVPVYEFARIKPRV